MQLIKTIITIGCLLFVATHTLSAKPFIPNNGQQILETLPIDAPPPRYKNSGSLFDGPLALNPQQTSQLLERAYLQGDPRALGQARANLEQAKGQDIDTLMLQARALQSDHQFADAKALLNQILSIEPAHPDALLTLSSILVVQGQFDEALTYCGKLTDPSLAVYQAACQAQVQSMTGELDTAKQTLNQLATIAPQLDDATARWIYLIQADAALRSRDTALATQVFDSIDSQTVPALMARADWLLKYGHYEDARQLLQDHTDKDALLLRLITAQLKLRDPAAQKNLALMKERINVWQMRQENAHLREQATYALLANQVDHALTLARQNWQQQRETADILVYATAAIKAGSQADINKLQQFMADTQFEYPALARDLRLGKIAGCTDCHLPDTQISSMTLPTTVSLNARATNSTLASVPWSRQERDL